jgi:hypothetical protein
MQTNTWPTIENFSRIISSLRGEIYFGIAEVDRLMSPMIACDDCGGALDRLYRCSKCS